MPLWRCPYCATPQPESSRCWLCGRSTTTCAACRHYRRGVAGGLGLCGKSARRLALRGAEVFPCWEAMPAQDQPPSAWDAGGGAPRAGEEASGRAARTFVPVDELRARDAHGAPVAGSRTAAAAADHSRWSLWGDQDP
jgi:hypothetical protein